MGFDIRLKIDTGGHEMANIDHCIGGCTYNLAPMFAKAFDVDCGVRYINGMVCSTAAKVVRDAADRIMASQTISDYMALEPDNGWGNYDVAVRFLMNILVACENHPKATIFVN